MILTSLCILCPFHLNSFPFLLYLRTSTNPSLKQEPLLSPRALLPPMLPLDPATPASLVRTTVAAAEVDTVPSTLTSAKVSLLLLQMMHLVASRFRYDFVSFMCFLSLFLPEASDFGPHGLLIAWPPAAKVTWKPCELVVLTISIPFDFTLRLSGPVLSCFCSGALTFENQPGSRLSVISGKGIVR